MNRNKRNVQKQKNKEHSDTMSENKKMEIKDFISIVLSGFAFLFSIYTYIQSTNLQEKYDRLNTYNSDLSYQINILEEYNKEDVAFVGNQIRISKPGHMTISPKLGGIQKVYVINYEEGNIVALLPVELFTNAVVATLDAQGGSYTFEEYYLDILGEDNDNYYSILYFIVEDYNHNFFSNMIVYEIDKKDISKIVTRIYNEIDLLHTYNEGMINLPDFDSEQIEEYLSLKTKLDEIL